MIERIHTGNRMSKIVKHGGLVYLCGQVGDGNDISEQTTDCLGRIDNLLLTAGTSREHILHATIWLADIADFSQMNSIWDAWIPEGHAPARAGGQVKLARPELKVEIIICAAVI
ncbi:hypothetical protein N183_35695 [Sinorhizobium sp. Sb3]|uniref:RidA family protein n=1 Tax=Sinorhizobium sp. Sb3 TaxID=1358417 RepID=UPI000728C764|nr:hypothetical protein N183_35695 [Sinorhizobium sp. Sb3]